jgi:acetyl-CoA C-acetyltransferase
MVNWLAALRGAKTLGAKMRVWSQVRPGFFAPIVALLKGLSDPLSGLNMGQTAENIAHELGITREEMDAFAAQSQQRATRAQADGDMDEVVALYDSHGRVFDCDDGVRAETTLEKLAKLRAPFDGRFGLVTAGNSSQVTDGAAMLLLASEEAVKEHQLSVLGRIVDVEWAGLNPDVMGLGPVFSTTPLLQRQQLTLNDIDYWEINEAFAAQVLGCIRAWESDAFCQKHFGVPALGSLDQSRLNIDGGAIALGHPVGSSGARIVLHLLHVLERKNATRGIASICIGGGQGGTMLVERG